MSGGAPGNSKGRVSSAGKLEARRHHCARSESHRRDGNRISPPKGMKMENRMKREEEGCSYGKENRWPPRLRGANEFKELLDSSTCELKPEFGSPELRSGRSLGPAQHRGCRGGTGRGAEGTLSTTPLDPGLGAACSGRARAALLLHSHS